MLIGRLCSRKKSNLSLLQLYQTKLTFQILMTILQMKVNLFLNLEPVNSLVASDILLLTKFEKEF
jgi:hypothetical protein